MASNYDKNRWELYDPSIPNEKQPHSFITKRKLEQMEKGIEEANIELEVGEVSIGKSKEDTKVEIIEDEVAQTKKLNITFPPAGQGKPGEPGKSAYDIWIENGNIGTEQEFLDYLKGIDGKDGKDGKNGADGEQGPAGASAYQLWLDSGNTGSIQDFFNSVKGEKGEQGEKGDTGAKGDPGVNGTDGKSAYEIWKMQPGNENKSITEFLESLKGEPGTSGSTEFLDFGNM